MKLKIEYHEFTTADVVRYFVKGFKAEPVRVESFYDPNKGIFIFKLFIEDKKES